jgi:hypothetical protein
MRRSKRAIRSSALLRPKTPQPLFESDYALLQFVNLFELARHFHGAKAHVLDLRSDGGDSPVDLPRQRVGVELGELPPDRPDLLGEGGGPSAPAAGPAAPAGVAAALVGELGRVLTAIATVAGPELAAGTAPRYGGASGDSYTLPPSRHMALQIADRHLDGRGDLPLVD